MNGKNTKSISGSKTSFSVLPLLYFRFVGDFLLHLSLPTSMNKSRKVEGFSRLFNRPPPLSELPSQSKHFSWTSLVEQWLRICLPHQPRLDA